MHVKLREITLGSSDIKTQCKRSVRSFGMPLQAPGGGRNKNPISRNVDECRGLLLAVVQG